MPGNDTATTKPLAEDLSLIAETIKQAGKKALDAQTRGVVSWSKSDKTPVSEADIAIDRFLHDRLLGARQGYGWVSEESAERRAVADAPSFFVDPIDGTRAFLADRDTWTVSVALVQAGQPIAAGIFNPRRDELYLAAASRGATRNGDPIHVSGKKTIDGLCLAGGQGVYRAARTLSEMPRPPVYVGAASMAYRLCLVACGACDATLSLSKKDPWDIAAGMLIVEEAGGLVTDREGSACGLGSRRTFGTTLAANQPLHAALITRLSGDRETHKARDGAAAG